MLVPSGLSEVFVVNLVGGLGFGDDFLDGRQWVVVVGQPAQVLVAADMVIPAGGAGAPGILILSWRAGEASRTNGPVSPHDFVPSAQSPVYLTEKNIVGERAPADFHGIPVLGSWGETWLVRTPILPPGTAWLPRRTVPTTP